MATAVYRMSGPLITYEEYMAEDETSERYDFIDGVRIGLNPTPRHQRILMNIVIVFHVYERVTRAGSALLAPCDVLIRKVRLRMRQPDVAFISIEQLAKNADENVPSPLDHAPELVVEIL